MSLQLFDIEGCQQDWPPTDRAWQFGDGVFRTLYAEAGHVRDLVGQVTHLLHDARLLGLEPLPAVDTLSETTLRVIGRQGKFRLKWVISAGDSAGGYLRAGPARAMLAVSALPEDYHAPSQAPAWICKTALRTGGGAWAAAKHLNRLEQVLARQEQDPHAYVEGVMSDTDGYVASGISSNLFWLDAAQQLHTHPLQGVGVQGRTRARILALAEAQGKPVRLSRWSLQQFKENAVEALFCNSLWGCVPVASVDTWEPRQQTVAGSFNAELGFR